MNGWYAVDTPGGALRGRDVGQGSAVVFQHGLGGDEAQVAACFPALPLVRRLTLECRGHGGSSFGAGNDYSFARFTDDVLEFVDTRGVGDFVAGGISMGAAIALRLAVRAPTRVRALILVRPAWLWWRGPLNMQPFTEVARLMREIGPERGRVEFESSETARRLSAEGPDNLVSLRKFFEVENPPETARLLEAMATDGPGVEATELLALRVPTLVIGHALDAVHPLSIAQTAAASIPGARLVQITPKATDKQRYLRELSTALSSFLAKVGNSESSVVPDGPATADRRPGTKGIVNTVASDRTADA